MHCMRERKGNEKLFVLRCCCCCEKKQENGGSRTSQTGQMRACEGKERKGKEQIFSNNSTQVWTERQRETESKPIIEPFPFFHSLCRSQASKQAEPELVVLPLFTTTYPPVDQPVKMVRFDNIRLFATKSPLIDIAASPALVAQQLRSACRRWGCCSTLLLLLAARLGCQR